MQLCLCTDPKVLLKTRKKDKEAHTLILEGLCNDDAIFWELCNTAPWRVIHWKTSQNCCSHQKWHSLPFPPNKARRKHSQKHCTEFAHFNQCVYLQRKHSFHRLTFTHSFQIFQFRRLALSFFKLTSLIKYHEKVYRGRNHLRNHLQDSFHWILVVPLTLAQPQTCRKRFSKHPSLAFVGNGLQYSLSWLAMVKSPSYSPSLKAIFQTESRSLRAGILAPPVSGIHHCL